MLAGESLKRLYRGIRVALRPQRAGATDLGGHEVRVLWTEGCVGFGRQSILLQLLQNIRCQQGCVGMVGSQIQGHPQVQKRIDRIGVAVQCGSYRIENLCNPVTRCPHRIEGDRLSSLQPAAKRINHRVRIGPE